MVQTLDSSLTITIKTPLRRSLNEYRYPDAEPPSTTTVYVELPPPHEPQSFSVDITPTTPFDFTRTLGYKCWLSVDGVKNNLGHGIRTGNHEYGTSIRGMELRDAETGALVTRECTFRPVETTDDSEEAAVIDKDDAAKLGCIQIEIRPYLWTTPESDERFNGRIQDPTKYHTQDALLGGGKVHEKALKGSSSSHRASLGRVLRQVHSHRSMNVVSKQATYVRFLYRSRASLQSLGIIPADPIIRASPLIRPGEIITIDSDDEHTERLLKREVRVKQEGGKFAETKQHLGETKAYVKGKVKQERKPKRERGDEAWVIDGDPGPGASKRMKLETIDLTG
ncbi:hypothetical protein BJ508DRAFT_414093 [Ascobolus immersus RN42]|uniref:DUF7918 domain-containing protein n=1 Tax=Ascobolus immersus RN42 TaxID=1160509 RepID=A0A3N4IE76_ASCIM|nr:hypothetical protein BJ508DRAFT_414093 [Ascobolus immersus RN42]